MDEANALYDFVGELMQYCSDHDIRQCTESAASRRTGSRKCRWDKFAEHGFLWDYPSVTRMRDVLRYLSFAQCAFDTPWQKFTGLLVDNKSHAAVKPIFGNADCTCVSHAVTLRGYDSSGVARTRLAQKYSSGLPKAIATLLRRRLLCRGNG